MANDPADKVKSIQRRAEERRQERKAGDVVKLPLWPDNCRGAPNEFLRSALFRVGNRHTKRKYFEDELIALLGGGELRYRGQELRQDDSDVWLQLLHLAKEQPLGEQVKFTAYSMLKNLGWRTTKRDYQRLRGCLGRLQATAVSLYCKRLKQGVSVSLIGGFTWKDEDGELLSHWIVRVPTEMKELFGERYFTRLEWDQRKDLGPIAKWLHGFYASHAEPYPMKVDTLREACGSETVDLREFRRMLKQALDALKSVGFLTDWQIEHDTAYVTRAGR